MIILEEKNFLNNCTISDFKALSFDRCTYESLSSGREWKISTLVKCFLCKIIAKRSSVEEKKVAEYKNHSKKRKKKVFCMKKVNQEKW